MQISPQFHSKFTYRDCSQYSYFLFNSSLIELLMEILFELSCSSAWCQSTSTRVYTLCLYSPMGQPGLEWIESVVLPHWNCWQTHIPHWLSLSWTAIRIISDLISSYARISSDIRRQLSACTRYECFLTVQQWSQCSVSELCSRWWLMTMAWHSLGYAQCWNKYF